MNHYEEGQEIVIPSQQWWLAREAQRAASLPSLYSSARQGHFLQHPLFLWPFSTHANPIDTATAAPKPRSRSNQRHNPNWFEFLKCHLQWKLKSTEMATTLLYCLLNFLRKLGWWVLPHIGDDELGSWEKAGMNEVLVRTVEASAMVEGRRTQSKHLVCDGGNGWQLGCNKIEKLWL